MRVPLTRGCGCQYNLYLDIQYKVRSCARHTPPTRSVLENKELIERIRKVYPWNQR